MTGRAVLTPLPQAIAMLEGDFVTMSRTADRVRPSSHPNAWRIPQHEPGGNPFGNFQLGFYVGALAAGRYLLRLNCRKAG
jgi:H+-transporting ATPase